MMGELFAKCKRGLRRVRKSRVKPRSRPCLEILESRLIPTVDFNASTTTLLAYNDVTGDGLTSDDIALPFSVQLEFTRTQIHFDRHWGLISKHETTRFETIDNGGTYGEYSRRVDETLEGGTIYWESESVSAMRVLFPDGQNWYHNGSTSETVSNSHVITKVAYFQSPTIAGGVFEDLNGNGIKDNGEGGLPDVEARLRSWGRNFFSRPASSGADGSYSLRHIGPSTNDAYLYLQAMPDVYTATTQKPEYGSYDTGLLISGPFRYTSGQKIAVDEVGLFRNVKVRGQVYEDLDGDGARDAGEPVMQGIIVFLDMNNDGVFDDQDQRQSADGRYFTTITSPKSDGTFELDNVGPGTIRVGVHSNSEHNFITVTEGNGYSLKSGQNVDGAVFGVFRNVPVFGMVFKDNDRDGAWHPARGEDYFPGVTVHLESGGKQYSTVTDAMGSFLLFAGPGSYRVWQELGATAIQTAPLDPRGYSGTMTRSFTAPSAGPPAAVAAKQTAGNEGRPYPSAFRFGRVEGATSPIQKKYQELGGPLGMLGLPVSYKDGEEVYDVARERDAGAGGKVEIFQKGALYMKPDGEVILLFGPVWERFKQAGGPDKVGLPTTHEYEFSDKEDRRWHRMDFTRGFIVYQKETPVSPVRSLFFDTYNNFEGPKSTARDYINYYRQHGTSPGDPPAFPNLEHFEVVRPESPPQAYDRTTNQIVLGAYNCVTWGIGKEEALNRYMPLQQDVETILGADFLSHLSPDDKRRIVKDGFMFAEEAQWDAFFGRSGANRYSFQPLNNLDFSLEPGKLKVVLFKDGDNFTHVIKQDADGAWSNKTGDSPVVRVLSPKDMAGGILGEPFKVYYRDTTPKQPPQLKDVGGTSSKAGTDKLVVQYSDAADFAGRYELRDLGRDGRLGSKDDAVIPLSVTHDANANQAVLRRQDGKPLAANRVFVVTLADFSKTDDTAAEEYRLIVGQGTKLSYIDDDGDAYTIALKGPGQLSFQADDADGDGRGAIGQLIVHNAVASSTSVTVTVKKAPGGDGLVAISQVEAAGLKSFTAAKCDLGGQFKMAGPLGALSIHDLRSSVAIDVAGSIGKLSVAAADGGSIRATTLGTLTALGDFNADLQLPGDSKRPLSLTKANIAGGISDATWAIIGNAGALTVKGAADGWHLDVEGSISALNLSQAEDVIIEVAKSIGSLSIAASGLRRRHVTESFLLPPELGGFEVRIV